MAKPPKKSQHTPSERLLIVMPTSLGNTVMATPTLRALRQLYPEAHITALVRRHLRPVLDACPWVDRIVTHRQKHKHTPGTRRVGPIKLAARLAGGRFDTAVLLPDSFRSALLVRTAGIPRRVGYDRDGRGGMLTDRLLPRRFRGKYVPVPTREQYLGLARYLGAIDPSPVMQLFTRPDDEQTAEALLAKAGLLPAAGHAAKPLILLHPGRDPREARAWIPQRFAQVADRCVEQLGALVALTGESADRHMLDQVKRHTRHPIVDLSTLGIDLTLLKSVVRRASLMISVDAGPRHIAAAFEIPLVTIFGPTDPTWSDTGFDRERQVYGDVYCRPCQKAICPLRGTADDHVCMTKVEADEVFRSAAALLQQVSGASRHAESAAASQHGASS